MEVKKGVLLTLILTNLMGFSEPIRIRALAANLTSGNKQSYSPDNGNHSNPEGAGARIIAAFKPDIVLIQEFNTSIPTRQWVNKTFGENYQFTREETVGIPNGIISRFPIIQSGVWDDPVLDNREFVWAKLRLPNEKELWAVSLHLHTKSEQSRNNQVVALISHIEKMVPKDALLLIGGDLNTKSEGESCFQELVKWCIIPEKPPCDAFGNYATNAKRNKPYDWLLASHALDSTRSAVKIGDLEFPHGLVFDSRVFTPLSLVPHVQEADSGVTNMQHMGVIRDFLVP